MVLLCSKTFFLQCRRPRSGFREGPLFSSAHLKKRIVDIFFIDFTFWACIMGKMGRTSYYVETPIYMMKMLRGKRTFYAGFVLQFVMWIVKWIAGTLQLHMLNINLFYAA